MKAAPTLPAWTHYAIVAFLTIAVCAPLLHTAFFCLDDYRYLDAVRQIDAGADGAWGDATVVENRWDDHWWIKDDTYVRFFRPYMISSYVLDDAIWGTSALGFTATNVVLHLAVTLLVLALLNRLLGSGAAATLGAAAFGLQFSHFENVYYVPGRASVMATLGMVAALVAHVATRHRPTRISQIAVATLCGIAFFGKESAAILPVMVVALDWLAPPDDRRLGLGQAIRRNAWFLAFAAGFAAMYMFVRTAALGEAGPGANVHPYIHWPSHPGFLERTWAVWLQYGMGIGAGTMIETFLEFPRQLYDTAGWFDYLGVAWVHGLLLWGCLTRGGRWMVLLFALSLLPLLPLYSSARHAYTATIGYCGLLALWCARQMSAGGAGRRLAVIAVAIAFVAVPAGRLVVFYRDYPPTLSQPDPAEFLAGMVTAGDMELDVSRPAYLLDFPGNWYEMQFTPATLGVALDRDIPALWFLSATRIGGKRPVQVTAVDAHTIELHRGNAPILPFAGGPGGKRSWSPGDTVERPGFTIEIAESKGERPTRVRVRFDASLDEVQLGRFERAGADRDGPWRLRRVAL